MNLAKIKCFKSWCNGHKSLYDTRVVGVCLINKLNIWLLKTNVGFINSAGLYFALKDGPQGIKENITREMNRLLVLIYYNIEDIR